MVHSDWKKSEKYFSSYKNENMSSTRNGIERIDLNCSVIIIPIIHENQNFIIIWHRYQEKIEQELLTKNQVKNNIYHLSAQTRSVGIKYRQMTLGGAEGIKNGVR